ncbi:MAG TPA: hypothetical protein VEF04_01265 [Blastocatellia bacterium]|nr:hypothetical protein [Blastocatellia bacterium]
MIGIAGASITIVQAAMLHKYLSHWSELEDHYLMNRKFTGKCFRTESWLANTKIFNFGLTLGADEEGMCIKSFFAFRFNHRSLFIPWNDIFVEEERRIFKRYLKLNFKKTPSIDLYLRKSTLENINRWEFDPKKRAPFQKLLQQTEINRGQS